MATKNSKKSYKNTQSSLKQKHTKPFKPYPPGSHSYQRIPHNESPFTKTLRLALVSHSLPTSHFPFSTFHSPLSTFRFPLSTPLFPLSIFTFQFSISTPHFPLSTFHSATQLLSYSATPSPPPPTIFFNFPPAVSFFFRIFAAGFGSPLGGPRGNRVQVPSSPAAVSSNELGRLRTKGPTEVESRPLLGPDDRSGVKAPVGAGRPKWSQGPYWGTGTSQKTCQSHNQSLTALEERTF